MIPENIPVPAGKSYLPYQLEGISYALKRRGTIIADEQGLGKTIQAIGILNADPSIVHVVIVCPASLKLNWWNELNEWCTRNDDIFVSIVSYGGLKHIKSGYIDLLIVDESHLVKEEKSARTQQLKRIAKMAKRIVLLSGTPISNKPKELWTQLQIACPEKWDPAIKMRELKPLSPLLVIGSLEPAKPKRPTGQGDGNGFFKFAKRYCGAYKRYEGRKSFWVFDGASNLEELQSKLRETCMVRRLKREVLKDLPPKRRQILFLESDEGLPPYEMEWLTNLTYENYDESIAKLESEKIAFREFSRIRHAQSLAKVPLLIEPIELTLEHQSKVIIFAHHSDVIDALAKKLEAYRPLVITGQTPLDERQANVEQFQNDPESRIIIGSIGAMGTGLTLTAASCVIFCEIDPVPGNMAQCEDRAHRIGQKNSVLVLYLIANGSIDARMVKIIVRKQAVISAALDPKNVIPENNVKGSVKLENEENESQAENVVSLPYARPVPALEPHLTATLESVRRVRGLAASTWQGERSSAPFEGRSAPSSGPSSGPSRAPSVRLHSERVPVTPRNPKAKTKSEKK